MLGVNSYIVTIPAKCFFDSSLTHIDLLVLFILYNYDPSITNEEIQKLVSTMFGRYISIQSISASISSMKPKYLQIEGGTTTRQIIVNKGNTSVDDALKEKFNSCLSFLKYSLIDLLKKTLRVESVDFKLINIENHTNRFIININNSNNTNNLLKDKSFLKQKRALFPRRRKFSPIKKSDDYANLVEKQVNENSIYSLFTEEERAIWMFWNNGPYLPHHHQDSKTTKKALEKIKKQLSFNSSAKIQKAISKYSTILSDPNTKLNPRIPGHKVGLDEFFGFTKFTKERMTKRNVNLDIKGSWFEELSCNGTEKWIKDKDLYPELTNILISIYTKKILGQAGVYGFRGKQKDQFEAGAKKLVEFYEKIKHKFLLNESIEDLAGDLVSSLKKEFKTVVPGHLCSKYTFEVILPKYLNDNAIVKSGEEIVI